MVDEARTDFPLHDSAASIADGCLGVVGNLLVRPCRDCPRVLVLFNGAINEHKILPLNFQRWTWAEDFDATIVSASDTLVSPETGLSLGWYHGGAQDFATTTLRPIADALDALGLGDAQRICFGSSAGGFAAVMASILGWSDLSIAINPQTDITRYHDAGRLPFLAQIGVDPEVVSPEAAKRLSLCAALEGNTAGGKVVIFQNRFDNHHFTRHFLPLVDAVADLPEARRRDFSLRLTADREAGHSPPNRAATLAMIREAAPELLA